MTPAEAQNLLLRHGCCKLDADDDDWTDGFLGMLRPYRGLNEQYYDEIVAALRVLAPHLRASPQLDRELMNALWGICTFGRLWGCEPDGMLRRNNLITDADAQRLAAWLDHICWIVAMLLDGQDDASAFAGP